ncbi:PRELI-like family-domain-containing protein [Yarrowia lipolytica]|uniref:YALI0C20141p n=2 Tax=Yarrowia lipolytica TaxID=4952 RepID=Q6CBC2_YARLI|nr:YALI0C20141p [Yarrowia lipolytica CLIB122]AOW03147.1 hypothetical protein YALI1_C28166g [Yarrowia lipolytica]KAB8281423.1 PRELI-like family-domain-containing protein [Yarrowia lipolytica]KAE8173042.1 PRELI-like family-domain-containing protein [Yarrowia lipolytica]KAJ8053654.1 PRELI-like family-domain-containing protein [Yarrowia lipolytica]RDW23342.1 PRELI-like family-domain-containing protein [Yarrowia lipolytica]|eukprot:XP_502040.2 YALI0C20141p [Yarrowia lipolytica CLIB122]
MVKFFQSSHSYDHDFSTVSLAFFNRYPNPYASHVLAADTIERYVDTDGNLHTTRLILKQGRLPRFVKPFLKHISESWIIEKSVVDPKQMEMETWSSNLEHRYILKVEERTTYRREGAGTWSQNQVSFVSNFAGWGVKDRIEKWSLDRFGENTAKSRQGMAFVMDLLKEKGLMHFQRVQLGHDFK